MAEEFAAITDPQTEQLIRLLTCLNAVGILDCRDPTLAAQQFTGLVNAFSLWPWIMKHESMPMCDNHVIEEAIRMFLSRYGHPRSKKCGPECTA